MANFPLISRIDSQIIILTDTLRAFHNNVPYWNGSGAALTKLKIFTQVHKL